jgi:hypothetical protein
MSQWVFCLSSVFEPRIFFTFAEKNTTMKINLPRFSFIPSVILVFLCAGLSAQNKVVREVSSFDKVKVSDNVNVTFIKADVEK